MPASGAPSALDDADLPYEEDLLRNPYKVRGFLLLLPKHNL